MFGRPFSQSLMPRADGLEGLASFKRFVPYAGNPRGARLDFHRTRFAPFPQLGSVGDDVSGSVGSHFVLSAAVLLISWGTISVGRIADNGTSSCRVLFAPFLSSTPIFAVTETGLSANLWLTRFNAKNENPTSLHY
jgi:hypothetical protein